MAASITVFKTGQELAAKAARKLSDLLAVAVRKRGAAAVALSGGTTPKLVYELLATEEYHDLIDWKNTHLFWGDERCVPPDAPESNYRMAREALLDNVPIPASSVHRIMTEMSPSEAAREYEQEILKYFGSHTPEFDLVLLGMGEDGHTASLFPGTTALNEQSKVVTDLFVPSLNTHRVTLTFPTINHACTVMFMISGKNKANVLREVFEKRPGKYPVERVAPVSGDLFWYLDADAASLLTKVGYA